MYANVYRCIPVNNITTETDSEQNNSLPFESEDDDNDDDNLWRICPHCKGDGCRSCDGEGVVYDPEPDGTN